MLPSYSDDLRLRIILHRHCEKQTVQEISQNLNVRQRTVVRISQLHVQTTWHNSTSNYMHQRIGREVVRHKFSNAGDVFKVISPY